MTNTFETDISNANFNSAQYYIDDDGSFKFVSPILASSNFDGSVPIFEGEIDAEDLNTGMLIQLDDDQFYGILQIFKDDPDLEDDPSTEITIQYLDSNNESQTITYDFLDTVTVRYEDWDEKYLGTQGWALTYGGNAIFANVGVRGRIEATEGEIEGNLIVSGGLFTSEDAETSGGIVLNNSGFTAYNTSGSTTFNIDAETGTVTIGGYATLEDVESSSAYFETLIDDLNDRISASISDLSIDLNSLSASVDFLYDAGFVTDDDLVTTGGTTINGNNITTGIINANLVNVSSGLTGNRGIKINSLGLTAYNSSQQPTFNINSETGTVTITGYATTSELSNFTPTASVNTYVTSISGNAITTGTINGQNVNVTNINAGNITTGSLSGDRISGGTIIGTTFVTKASGQRIRMQDTGFGVDTLDFLNGSSLWARLISSTTNSLEIQASNGVTFSGTIYPAGLVTSGNISNTAATQLGLTSGLQTAFRVENNTGNIYSYGIDQTSTGSPANVRVGLSAQLLKATSSQRWKKEIIPVQNTLLGVDDEKISSLESSIDPFDVLLLSPSEFQSTAPADLNERMFGFIAEDVAKKFPWAAGWDEEGIPNEVKDRPIIAALLVVVNDQQETIEDLQSRVLQLESQLGG